MACKMEGWRKTPVCRLTNGRFSLPGIDFIPPKPGARARGKKTKNRKARRLPPEVLRRFQDRWAELSKMDKELDHVLTLGDKARARQILKMAEKLKKQHETDQRFIDKFIQDSQDAVEHAKRDAEAWTRVEAQRAAAELRKALDAKDALKAEMPTRITPVIDEAKEVLAQLNLPSTPKPPKLPDPADNDTNKPKPDPDKPKKKYRVDGLDELVDSGKVTKKQAVKIQQAADAFAQKTWKGVKKANDILGGLPGDVLNVLANPVTQVGLELAFIGENVRRIKAAGGGNWEAGFGIAGRVIAAVLEGSVPEPAALALVPWAEWVGERIGRGTGFILDKTGAGDAGVKGAVDLAKGLDDLFGHGGGDPIDISGPRKPNPYDEVNDPNAPDRPCVGIQCAVRPLLH